MSIKFSGKPFTIVGDGKWLAIILDDYAYVLEEYYLKNIQMQHIRDFINVETFGGNRHMEQCLKHIDVELSLTCGDLQQVEASQIKIKNAETMSIFELLKEINEKLSSRRTS